LQRLRSKFIVATLSNGNIALLTNMAKRAGLPWDCILSSELARHYKPAREVYLTAADLLDLEPANIMMVAAHQGDLDAAAALGFQTAFVERPLEYGPVGNADSTVKAQATIIASDFLDLADRLGV
jgi:2-haloacid dehalogenase